MTWICQQSALAKLSLSRNVSGFICSGRCMYLDQLQRQRAHRDNAIICLRRNPDVQRVLKIMASVLRIDIDYVFSGPTLHYLPEPATLPTCIH